MKKSFLLIVILAFVASTAARADEPTTEAGIYLFATEVSGEASLRNITADVDISFSDIVDNLDIGFMGYIEHRRGGWSFIGDFAYLGISDDKSTTVGRVVEIGLDAELTQTVLEGFAGYRFLEKAFDNSDLGIDFVFGARYVELDIDISLDASLLSFSASGSRDRTEDWVDAVVGARIKSDYRNGWGSMVWLDVGDGSDSSSYQAMALVNYSTDSNWKFYAGWRLLNLEYETGSGDSTFGVDLDYSGPMAGASYRF